MSEKDIKDVKGLLGGIYIVSLIIMGALLYPIIDWYSSIAVFGVGFLTVYLAENSW